jgi:hypothetical protein
MVTRSDECRVLVYNLYMWRRKWGQALALAQEAGFSAREIVTPAEAAGCRALLILGDDVSPAEADMASQTRLPVLLTPDATTAHQRLPQATLLPADRAEQLATWQALLAPGPQ